MYAQDSLDLSKMTRSQLRQYRLLIENRAKAELQKERAYYSYTLKVLEERHKFHIDSMSKLRALERMNYNKQLKLLEEKIN
ncbi:MAG: hypothetical protein HC917_18220 [Richelia sp. SM2_1_7]|nr:hypothetical protein [Richelia sp. SM2_1_7]